MTYFEIKRRMIELVYILRSTPKEKNKRKGLRYNNEKRNN